MKCATECPGKKKKSGNHFTLKKRKKEKTIAPLYNVGANHVKYSWFLL